MLPTYMSKYNTLAKPSTGMYKEKGSKFLAFAYPVTHEPDIKQILAALKKEYFDARHYCYAYRLGVTGTTYRVNDDGEPNHSAGDPILGQLKSANLTQVLLVVVRYFGGIKLGVSGLVHAYKTAAQDALAQAEIVQKTEEIDLVLKFYYDQINQVMSVVKELNLKVVQQAFDTSCKLLVRFSKTDETLIRTKISKIEGVNILMDT